MQESAANTARVKLDKSEVKMQSRQTKIIETRIQKFSRNTQLKLQDNKHL